MRTAGRKWPAWAREPGGDDEDARLLLMVAVACLPALKPGERLSVFEGAGDCERFAALGKAGVEALAGRRVPRADLDTLAALGEARRFVPLFKRRGIAVLGAEAAEYPPLLREIADPPFALFVRGRLPDPGLPCVAVVGTRDPDMAAYSSARAFARQLAAAGIPVVSGLALGIDRAAHEGALDAGGATVAVLGCGIDAVYPRSHAGLAARILKGGGAIVSEYPPGREPMRHRFPERNRIISGMSRSLIVAQAPAESGALITADFALEQGRDILVLGSGCRGERGAGAAALAAQGAALAESIGDLEKVWRGNA